MGYLPKRVWSTLPAEVLGYQCGTWTVTKSGHSAPNGETTKMERLQPEHITELVYHASKAAFSDLLSEHPDQSFYAFGLFTNDCLHFLRPCANSEEELTATVLRYRETVDPKYGHVSTRAGMRWAYGDWGFFTYERGDHFAEVNRLLDFNYGRMLADEEFDGDFELLWQAIGKGFWRLEAEGFFGKGTARSAVTLLLVGDLPIEMGKPWLVAMNPPSVVDRYLNWDCDAPDS